MDKRVRRTRDKLGDALVALMQEKSFDDIRIQDVLDRAKIGRSAFYSHFKDKDDLFLSDADEFFEGIAGYLSSWQENSNRVAPVAELFSHVAEMRPYLNALRESGKWTDIRDLASEHFARGINKRLAEISATRALSPTARAARAHALSGSLLALLEWWLRHKTPASPVQMDTLFHQLAWSGIRPANPAV